MARQERALARLQQRRNVSRNRGRLSEVRPHTGKPTRNHFGPWPEWYGGGDLWGYDNAGAGGFAPGRYEATVTHSRDGAEIGRKTVSVTLAAP